MKKIFCLDTNVLLYDPQAIFSFDDNSIVIPLVVLEEIDNIKNRRDEVGSNARIVSRQLDQLRVKGNLSEGVELENGGILRILRNTDRNLIPPDLGDPDKPDNMILAVTQELIKSCNCDVTLITKDINVRVKADALQIPCEDYLIHRVTKDPGSLYRGVDRLTVSSKDIASFYGPKGLTLSKSTIKNVTLHPNEFLVMKSDPDSKASIGRFISEDRPLIPLGDNHKAWGLKPRNKEQKFALDLLLDESIKLVSLVGKAGTGKTLLATAAGIQQVIGSEEYSKLVISRPIQPIGKDLGYLPGTMEEKMDPWMKPIMDNLGYLFGSSKNGKKSDPYLELTLASKKIEIEAITYIRGRSIANAFIIIDEAQNLSVHELKTIITRVGENTKIVLTGDIDQIDNSFVDSVSNGLTYAVEKFKDHNIAGHVTLIKGERSELATLASDIL